jgi:urease accessory protein
MNAARSAIPVHPSTADTGRWHGQLELTFAARWSPTDQRSSGRTQLIAARNQAPLKVQRPFTNPDGSAQVVMLHTAGGMVGGDRLTTGLQLEPAAQVLVTTAAAAKVYRSTGATAQQQVTMQLGAGACLEWLPQETIVFDQAQYQQDLRVELGAGAQWLGWDVTRFGRSARGERFLSGSWRSRTEVWQDGQPLWLDRQWLPASEQLWNSPHGLGGMPVVGTLAWVGQAVSAEFVAQVRQLEPGSGQFGVTRLPLGLLCRYRGDSSTAVRQWFTVVWQLIRTEQWQRVTEVPRVWML